MDRGGGKDKKGGRLSMVIPLDRFLEFQGNPYEFVNRAIKRSYQLSLHDPEGEVGSSRGKLVHVAIRRLLGEMAVEEEAILREEAATAKKVAAAATTRARSTTRSAKAAKASRMAKRAKSTRAAKATGKTKKATKKASARKAASRSKK